MKKYVIAVGSAKISKQVQKALFKAGFGWDCGGASVQEMDRPFIYVNYGGKSELLYGTHGSTITRDIIKKDVIVLSSQEVISDAASLDGAKYPAKEMTVAEIQEALGHDVKVIDG